MGQYDFLLGAQPIKTPGPLETATSAMTLGDLMNRQALTQQQLQMGQYGLQATQQTAQAIPEFMQRIGGGEPIEKITADMGQRYPLAMPKILGDYKAQQGVEAEIGKNKALGSEATEKAITAARGPVFNAAAAVAASGQPPSLMDQQMIALQMHHVARLNGDDPSAYGIPEVSADPQKAQAWVPYMTAVARAAATPKEAADIGKTTLEAGQVVPLAQAKISEAASAATQATTGQGRLTEEIRKNTLMYGGDTGKLSPANEAVAKSIANYDMDPIPSARMTTPGGFGPAIMARVAEINPQWNAANYAAAKQGVEKFGAGQLGSTVRSANTALAHLDTVSDAIKALQNGDTPLFNKVANMIAYQTGQAQPTDFDALKTIVSNELVKFVTASGGTGDDRKEIANTMKNVNSPAQLFGVVNQYQSLMGGQLNGLERQYKATTGRTDFADKYLSPEVQAMRAKQGQGQQQGPVPSMPATGAPVAPMQPAGASRTFAAPPEPKQGQTLTAPDGSKHHALFDQQQGRLIWYPPL